MGFTLIYFGLKCSQSDLIKTLKSVESILAQMKQNKQVKLSQLDLKEKFPPRNRIKVVK